MLHLLLYESHVLLYAGTLVHTFAILLYAHAFLGLVNSLKSLFYLIDNGHYLVYLALSLGNDAVERVALHGEHLTFFRLVLVACHHANGTQRNDKYLSHLSLFLFLCSLASNPSTMITISPRGSVVVK